jgi:hypothetical protein
MLEFFMYPQEMLRVIKSFDKEVVSFQKKDEIIDCLVKNNVK